MTTIYATLGTVIYLGQVGEHKATSVAFDVTELRKQYPQGTATVIVERENEIYHAICYNSGTKVYTSEEKKYGVGHYYFRDIENPGRVFYFDLLEDITGEFYYNSSSAENFFSASIKTGDNQQKQIPLSYKLYRNLTSNTSEITIPDSQEVPITYKEISLKTENASNANRYFIWEILNTDLQTAYKGQCHLIFSDGKTVVKSEHYQTLVTEMTRTGSVEIPESTIDAYLTEIQKGVAYIENGMAAVENSEQKADEYSDKAEAWAVGTKDGVPVASTDDQYQKHSKHWAEKSELSAGDSQKAQEAAETAQSKAETAQSKAEGARNKAETWAVGTEEGVIVPKPATDANKQPHETNNSKYWSEQSHSSAISSSESASSAAGSNEEAMKWAKKAETAKGNAETAQSKAETAQSKAETAQVAAETAQNKAETAQVNAETAQQAAETAQTEAEAARDKAETWKDQAEAWSKQSPQIKNGYWWTWDSEKGEFLSSNVPATLSITRHYPDRTSLFNAATNPEVKTFELAIIKSDINDPENSELYFRNEKKADEVGSYSECWTSLGDLSGIQGVSISKILEKTTLKGTHTYRMYFTGEVAGTAQDNEGYYYQFDLKDAIGLKEFKVPTTPGKLGEIDNYTITWTDGTTNTLTIQNGTKIKSIKRTKQDPSTLIDTYTITDSLDEEYTFEVGNGKGIVNITGPESSKNRDTYTINYNDNSTSNYTVTNGIGISSISDTKVTHTNGELDTYTINFDHDLLQGKEFKVYNGLNGIDVSEIIVPKNPAQPNSIDTYYIVRSRNGKLIDETPLKVYNGKDGLHNVTIRDWTIS